MLEITLITPLYDSVVLWNVNKHQSFYIDIIIVFIFTAPISILHKLEKRIRKITIQQSSFYIDIINAFIFTAQYQYFFKLEKLIRKITKQESILYIAIIIAFIFTAPISILLKLEKRISKKTTQESQLTGVDWKTEGSLERKQMGNMENFVVEKQIIPNQPIYLLNKVNASRQITLRF